MEVVVGFPSQGEIEGIGIEGKAFRGWTTRRGERPLPRVKCTQNEGYQESEVRQGEWQTKAVLAIPEIEWPRTRGLADVVQIHPRTIRV